MANFVRDHDAVDALERDVAAQGAVQCNIRPSLHVRVDQADEHEHDVGVPDMQAFFMPHRAGDLQHELVAARVCAELKKRVVRVFCIRVAVHTINLERKAGQCRQRLLRYRNHSTDCPHSTLPLPSKLAAKSVVEPDGDLQYYARPLGRIGLKCSGHRESVKRGWCTRVFQNW